MVCILITLTKWGLAVQKRCQPSAKLEWRGRALCLPNRKYRRAAQHQVARQSVLDPGYPCCSVANTSAGNIHFQTACQREVGKAHLYAFGKIPQKAAIGFQINVTGDGQNNPLKVHLQRLAKAAGGVVQIGRGGVAIVLKTDFFLAPGTF